MPGGKVNVKHIFSFGRAGLKSTVENSLRVFSDPNSSSSAHFSVAAERDENNNKDYKPVHCVGMILIILVPLAEGMRENCKSPSLPCCSAG